LKTLLLAFLFGGIFAIVWLYLGEPWKDLCDGENYMQIYEGHMAAAPFGYRVLTPYLASLLPWDAKFNFSVITISCLILTTGVVSLYSKKISKSLAVSSLACFFWVFSFPFIYYGTTLIRADGPMLLLLAIVFLASHYRVYSLGIMALIAAGILSHETMLIFLPALWLDKLFSTEITGGKQYSYINIILISLFSLAFFAISRLYISVLPGDISYEKGIVPMISFVKDYSGGWPKHLLRIYSAYGPALLYAIFYAAPWNSIRRSISFYSLLLCVMLMTLLATDTLRVMGIFYIPVIFFAACFVVNVFRSGRIKTAVTLLVIQAMYTLIIYGHLRTFKSSVSMNILAALLSLTCLLLVLYVEYSCNEKFSKFFIRFMKTNPEP